MQDANEPRVLKIIKSYSLWFGGSAVAALQALKTDFLTFPPAWKIYLSYFFSIVVVVCVFGAGSSIIGFIKRLNELNQAVNSQNKKHTKEIAETEDESE